MLIVLVSSIDFRFVVFDCYYIFIGMILVFKVIKWGRKVVDIVLIVDVREDGYFGLVYCRDCIWD